MKQITEITFDIWSNTNSRKMDIESDNIIFDGYLQTSKGQLIWITNAIKSYKTNPNTQLMSTNLIDVWPKIVEQSIYKDICLGIINIETTIDIINQTTTYKINVDLILDEKELNKFLNQIK